jgi:hypothetical protein
MLNQRSIVTVKWAYFLAMLVAIFSGLGNMPMYGRYYVADIPGFGWSGNFFVNINLHYLSGAVLLGLASYLTIIYMQRSSQTVRLSTTGAIRVVLIGLALVSGVLAALKNLPAVNLPMAGLMAVAFIHLGTAMGALFFSLGCWLLKKPWTIDASHQQVSRED